MIPPAISKAASALIRKFRTLTARQWKIAGLIFLALMAAGPIWFIIYDIMGRKAWKDYEAAERARGVRLSLSDFAEPKVPDEQNFAALPIFTSKIQQRLPTFPRGYPGKIAQPEFGLQFQAGAWRTYFAKAGWIDTPSQDVASDLRLALVRYDDALIELTNGLQRPHCILPALYGPASYYVPYPYRSVIKSSIAVAGLRAHVSLLGGDSAAALRDLHLITGIRQRFATKELLSSLARDKVSEYEPAIIYEGLSRHAWNAEQLREIVELVQKNDPLKDLAYKIELKRALANHVCEGILTGNLWANAHISYHPETWIRSTKVLQKLPGIVRRNQLVANRHLAMLRDHVDLDAGIFRDGEGEERVNLDIRYYWIADSVVDLMRDTQVYLSSAAKLRLASTACALELYHLQHNAYPQSLVELVPDYLPAAPNEPTSQDSLIYYPTDDGRYRLYSRGADGEDDGGRIYRYGNRADYDLPWVAPVPR